MADKILIHDGFDPQYYIKIDTVFPEFPIADYRFKTIYTAGIRLKYFLGYIDGHSFDMLQITAITDSDGNEDGTRREGLHIIDDDRRSNFLVWHDNHIFRHRLYGRITPIHIDAMPRFIR